MEEYIEIGQIVNTNGIKGVVKVNPFTDDITRFEDLKSIYIEFENELVEVYIEKVSYIKKQVLLKLKNIDTIEEAEKYRDKYIKINRKDSIKLQKDMYFIADLMGLEVYTIENVFLGKIVDVFQTGKSNDVYAIKDNSGKQILLPAISKVVKQVDLENKKVIVNLLKGLI